MRKVLLSLAALVFLLSLAPRAHAIVNVDGRYWLSTIDSSVKMTSASVIGTEIDVVDDLGFDKTKSFFEGRITLEFGKHNLRYAFVPLDWDGSTTISKDLVFGGKTYTASTKVNSEVKLTYHRLGYEYDIIDLLSNKIGIIFEVKYLETIAGLKAPGLSFDESVTIKAPIPTVGVAAQVGLPLLFNVGGEITGVSYGTKAYLIDAELAANFKPAPFVVISGGYRLFKLHIEDGDDEATMKISGPFVQLRADF